MKIKDVEYTITEGESFKSCNASDGSYHYRFNKNNGNFIRWGKTDDDDPQWSPAGPEILDLEISSGFCKMGCEFCYKDNSPDKPFENMSFEMFKMILNKMPKTLTQIAFGITDLQTNSDFFKMMEYSREQGIIPNFTLTGIDITNELADKISKVCGAVAVSVHSNNKNIGYDTIKMLTDRGMEQVNIHLFTSEETNDFIWEVIKDKQDDDRLAKMNAIVLLGVKGKGKAKGKFNPLSFDKFSEIVLYCLTKGISLGFDSCSAPKFERYITNSDFPKNIIKRFKECAESCESSLFSSYINQKGQFFPCSFCEGEEIFPEGIDVVNCEDFVRDIWLNPKVCEFRNKLLKANRNCIAFPEIN